MLREGEGIFPRRIRLLASFAVTKVNAEPQVARGGDGLRRRRAARVRVPRAAFARTRPRRTRALRCRLLPLCLLPLCLLLTPPAAHGQSLPEDIPFELRADRLEYERRRDFYQASGAVELEIESRRLRADELSFDRAGMRGVATGNILLEEGETRLFADTFHFELGEVLQGRVLNGRLETGPEGFTVHGRELRKTGARHYEIDDARFSACNCPEGLRPPWEVRASRADLELGGYATLRGTRLALFGVPVLWLPWMRYPVKQERETGLLVPEWGRSARTGAMLDWPLFWAVHPQVNILLTPRYFQERGLGGALELEYRGRADTHGRLGGALLPKDDEVEAMAPGTPFDDDRWSVFWRADHQLAAGWRHKVDAKLVSDNQYLFDFREFGDAWQERVLEAATFVEGRFGARRRYGLSMELRYADDQANPDDIDRDDFLLQRAPELRISVAPLPLGIARSRLAFDLRYTHWLQSEDEPGQKPFGAAEAGNRFALRQNAGGQFFDTGPSAVPSGQGDCDDLLTPASPLECDGRFQEGEPHAHAGQRLLMNPRLHFPFRLPGRIDALPTLAYHGSFYRTEHGRRERRELVTGALELGARLRGIAKLPLGIGAALQVIEPKLVYSGVLKKSQQRLPLFSPRGDIVQQRLRILETENVLRDPRDRIGTVNALTLMLSGRWYRQDALLHAAGRAGGLQHAADRAGGQAGVRTHAPLADITLAFHRDFAGDSRRQLFLDGALHPAPGLRSRFQLGVDFEHEDEEVREALLEVAYRGAGPLELALAWRRVKDITPFYEGTTERPFAGDRFRDFESDFEDIDQGDLRASLRLGPRLALDYRIAYSFADAYSIRHDAGLHYTARCRCFGLRMELSDEHSRGLALRLRLDLGAFGAFDVER